MGARAIVALTMAIGLTVLATAPLASAAPEGDAKAGERVFAKCRACHKIDASGTSGLGPNLNRVIGRRAGTVPAFRYSPAMIANGKAWTPAALDAYLAAPAKAMPGNRMAFIGLKVPADRRNVIAYLKTASR